MFNIYDCPFDYCMFTLCLCVQKYYNRMLTKARNTSMFEEWLSWEGEQNAKNQYVFNANALFFM